MLNKMLRYVGIIFLVEWSKYYLESFIRIWSRIRYIWYKQFGLVFIETPCPYICVCVYIYTYNLPLPGSPRQLQAVSGCYLRLAPASSSVPSWKKHSEVMKRILVTIRLTSLVKPSQCTIGPGSRKEVIHHKCMQRIWGRVQPMQSCTEWLRTQMYRTPFQTAHVLRLTW